MTDQAIIGLIGGMSWESSAQYYRLINEAVRARLGGLASARTLMWSFDFAEIEALQHQGRWPELSRRLADAARALEAAPQPHRLRGQRPRGDRRRLADPL